MKGSWKLGEVAGIGIYVHWTFSILIAWILFSHVAGDGDLATALRGVGFILAIFACVVLHELGHALTARRFNIQTHDITLLPIGGVARLERMPEDPIQELWVALAGPAVNVVIAGVLFVVIVALHGVQQVAPTHMVSGAFLANLLAVNLWLVVFNLIPAFPMDGGRVLRALLATRLDYVQATQTAARVGQFMAMLFGLLGLFGGNPMLLFIALFVYLGAAEEEHQTTVKAYFKGVPVRAAMVRRFRVLAPDGTLAGAVDELLAGSQVDFPVVDAGNGRVVGMLTRHVLVKALAEGKMDQRVGDVMVVDCPSIEESQMLGATFERMRQIGCSSLPVTSGGQLVGLVTLENIGEYMMIQSAIRQNKNRADVDDIFKPT